MQYRITKPVDKFRDKLVNCLSHNKVLAEENEALNQRLSEALVAADRLALEYAELRSRLLEEQERPNS